MIQLTLRQGRQFILMKHGLVGEHQYTGKAGALEFIRNNSCIQFDPIDICGKNPELVLQSRVKGFKKEMLRDLLYKDRLLFDYPDKNLAIIPIEYWPYFERYRQASRRNAEKYEEMNTLSKQVHSYIEDHGAVCSNDLKLDGEIRWQSAIHWSGGNNLTRSVLEQMYSTGELIVHHKKGTRKYYDLAQRHIPEDLLNAPEPLPCEFEHQKWRVLRRIGTLGLMWNKSSDAWLNIWGLKTEERNKVFQQLLNEHKIFEVTIEGQKDIFYCCAENMPMMETVLQSPKLKPRCELIAPLDNFMWDRRIIKALFDFDYTWEIYTPLHKRKYGHYVLPLLYGEGFIGRGEIIADRETKTLMVKNIWYENHVKQTKKLESAVNKCLDRFRVFNDCHTILYL